jgi:hypothetical protein
LREPIASLFLGGKTVGRHYQARHVFSSSYLRRRRMADASRLETLIVRSGAFIFDEPPQPLGRL